MVFEDTIHDEMAEMMPMMKATNIPTKNAFCKWNGYLYSLSVIRFKARTFFVIETGI
jgi:hypothetical protein